MKPRTAQKEGGGRKAFDKNERAWMRGVLLRYAAQHKIGSWRLQARIAEGSGRSRDLVPEKTLQRFLAGRRVNDGFLVAVHRFCESMGGDESERFGRAAGSFFASAARGAERAKEAGRWFGGCYAVLSEEERQGPELLDRKEERFSVRKGRLTVEEGEEPGVLSVVEESAVGAAGSGLYHRWEGIALNLDTPVVVLLRSAVTGFPKCYWLYRDGAGQRYGFVSARELNEPEEVSFTLRQPRSVVLEYEGSAEETA